MAKKIYLSPSSQSANTYAVGNTTEQEECRKIARATAKALTRCGFDTKCADYGTMYTRIKESNDWGADLHVPIHTNAFNKQVAGTRMMSYDKTGEGYKACKAIFDALAPLTPGTSENISTHPELYEIKNSNAPCAYIEVDFHDVPNVAQWLIDHTEEIAEAICKGICNYFGVKYVAPASTAKPAEKPVEEKKTIYRVQVGAFHNRDYAEAMLQELKGKGYDAFIVTA